MCCDEGTMVSYDMFDKLKDFGFDTIILVGDPDQLGSIQPGYLFETFKNVAEYIHLQNQYRMSNVIHYKSLQVKDMSLVPDKFIDRDLGLLDIYEDYLKALTNYQIIVHTNKDLGLLNELMNKTYLDKGKN